MLAHDHRDAISDDVLLQHVGNGCEECFALLFHRYFRQVFALAFKILRERSEAEDILQEVFLAIFLQRERFDPAKGSVKTWILQFAYFRSLLRRRYLRVRNFYKQEEVVEGQQIRAGSSDNIAGMNRSEWTRFVESGIGKLNGRQRQTIEMVHFEGRTLKEVADILRESLPNTRNYYYRGLKALRVYLEVTAEAQTARQEALLGRKNAYHLKSE
jgi:RNA polymerase sigma-70 factor (ECF subfamily)